MIAWGPGSFESEEVTDWVDDLIESKDLAAIVLAMQSMLEFAGTDEVEPQDCLVAIAACEAVACANGHPSPKVPKNFVEFIREMNVAVDENALSLALKTIERVKQTPGMLRHFKDAGSLDEWLDNLEDLESRLV